MLERERAHDAVGPADNDDGRSGKALDLKAADKLRSIPDLAMGVFKRRARRLATRA